MPGDERLPRERRIRTSADFARVYRCRWSAATGPLVLYAAPSAPAIPRDATVSEASEARIGLSVSRRIGNAVVRNRWKRRLREAFRVIRPRLPAGNDYVLVVRSGLPPAGAEGARRIEESIVELASRVTARPSFGGRIPADEPLRRPPTRRGRKT